MAKGQEAKRIVDDFLKEFNSANDFLMTIIPCIIPNSDEDKEILEQGLKIIKQLDSVVKDCDGSLSDLDEFFDIDKLVSDYPKIKNLFHGVNNGEDAEEIVGKEFPDET